jgi:hypothetical protein
MWFGRAVQISLHISFKNRRISRITPILAFWYGFIRGLLTPVNRKTSKFMNYPNKFLEIGRI